MLIERIKNSLHTYLKGVEDLNLSTGRSFFCGSALLLIFMRS